MQIGDKISILRKNANITQSDLGKQLNISPQAVSKWERNIAEPDIETIKKLASIFNVKITEFFDLEKEEVDDTDNKKIVCEFCGKELNDDEIFEKEPNVICKSCKQAQNENNNEIDKLINQTKNEKQKNVKSEFVQKIIWTSLITLVVGLIFVFSILSADTGDSSDMTAGESILGTIVILILTFSFVFQLFIDGVLKDFLGFFTRSFRLPGIIVGFDLGGILLLLLWKVIAPIFAFIISCFVFAFGVILAIMLSPIFFIFDFPKAIKNKL